MTVGIEKVESLERKEVILISSLKENEDYQNLPGSLPSAVQKHHRIISYLNPSHVIQ